MVKALYRNIRFSLMQSSRTNTVTAYHKYSNIRYGNRKKSNLYKIVKLTRRTGVVSHCNNVTGINASDINEKCQDDCAVNDDDIYQSDSGSNGSCNNLRDGSCSMVRRDILLGISGGMITSTNMVSNPKDRNCIKSTSTVDHTHNASLAVAAGTPETLTSPSTLSSTSLLSASAISPLYTIENNSKEDSNTVFRLSESEREAISIYEKTRKSIVKVVDKGNKNNKRVINGAEETGSGVVVDRVRVDSNDTSPSSFYYYIVTNAHVLDSVLKEVINQDKVKEDIKIDSFVGQKVATILFQASENEYTSKSNSETNVTTVDATLVKYNIKNDLALLRCMLMENSNSEAKGDYIDDSLQPIPILKRDAPQNESSLNIGSRVFSFGHPFGFFPLLFSSGIVSGMHRQYFSAITDSLIEDTLITDIALDPGSSGGALVNTKGELIGITTALFSPTSSKSNVPVATGIGYVINSNDVLELLQKRKEKADGINDESDSNSGVLGIHFSPIDTSFRLGINSRLLISSIDPGSIADTLIQPKLQQTRRVQGSIVPGDVVVSIGENIVETPKQCERKLKESQRNEGVVTIVIERRKQINGKAETLSVELDFFDDKKS